MLNTSFKTIGLIIRQDNHEHMENIRAICQTLSNYGDILVHNLDGHTDICGHRHTSFKDMRQKTDLAFSIGGDGTLLHAARHLVDFNIPLVGINLGRLGFLADVTMNELERHLDGIFEGRYSIEKRFLLNGEVYLEGDEIKRHIALNDIILHSHQSISMIEFEVFSDQQLINKQRADGLIVSTPTGSTAYALSGGGPIMHPTSNTMALVPICPHTLSNRPIVLPADQVIEIRITQPGMVGQVSFDGHTKAIIKAGDSIKISRHEQEMTLIHPENYDYFHILRAKLKWSNQP